MTILARYVHGSEDSRDCDVIYIVDKIPSILESAEFCNADPSENRNIAIIKGGVIAQCYKGFPDEVNNALLSTYPLHLQYDELLITRALPRDILLKQVSVLRKLLMEMRHTSLKRESRKALRSGFAERLKTAKMIDLQSLHWEIPEMLQLECKKRMAFQLGQVIALEKGVEVYTKQAIVDIFPGLHPYLYRVPCDMSELESMKNRFIDDLNTLNIKDIGNEVILCDCGGVKRRIFLKGKEHDEE